MRSSTNKLQTMPPIHFNIIGHRGLAALAPENTLASFQAAKQQGLNWVEFDTQICGSGEWVVLHDYRVDRTTNGQGLLTDLSIEEIKHLDAGSWFHPRFKDERIPLLKEVLSFLTILKLQPNIEIKTMPEKQIKNTTPPSTQYDLENFLEIIDQYWPKDKAPPLISSFELEPLLFIRKKAPHLPIGYLIEKWETSILETIIHYNFQSLHCDYQGINQSQLAKANQENVPVLLYTVNDQKLSENLLKQGSFALFSDNLMIS